MKQALIDGTRVCQVEYEAFPVADPLYWVECPDDIVADQYTYESGTFVPVPVPEPLPDPGIPDINDLPTSGPWLYLCSLNTDMTVPPNGQIRFNNADPLKANQITLSTISDNAYDLTAVIVGLRSKDQVYIQDQDNATKWVRYLLNSPSSDRDGWWILSFDLIEGQGNFISGNNKLAVLFGGQQMGKSLPPVRGKVREDA